MFVKAGNAGGVEFYILYLPKYATVICIFKLLFISTIILPIIAVQL